MFTEQDVDKYETWQQTADRLQAHLDSLAAESLSVIQDTANKYSDYEFVAFTSTGKDSMVMLDLVQKVLPDVRVIFNNTSLDCAETYRMVKAHGWEISNPPIGFYQYIKKYNYIPNRVSRGCCTTFKEGNSIEYLKDSKKLIQFMGVRNDESTKRAKYEMIMTHEWAKKVFSTTNIPKEWINFAPIVDFTDEEIWLLILMKKFKYNNLYNYGFNRVGCLVCPYSSDYVDLLTAQRYPKAWQRWQDIVIKHYYMFNIERRLHWSLDEWCNGQWKQAISKDSILQSKAPTKENVHALAELKGISDDMAKKYFRKVCSCGKKCNPTEVAMFYKTQGRMEGEEDNRTVLCQKSLCELMGWSKQEYLDKANEFRDGGCNLF